MSDQCNSGKSRAQINIERLDAAQRRGRRLNLRAPVDLSLNRYGMYDIQQLIANLVKLSFVLGMNTPDSPVFDIPYELFQKITDLNKFIYGNVGRYSS